MKRITEILSEKVGAAFEKCGYDASLGQVSVSDRLDLCQFQCNGSFAAAKRYKKAPLVVAGEVCDRLADDAVIKSAEAFRPGFINIVLTDEYLAARLAEQNAEIGRAHV